MTSVTPADFRAVAAPVALLWGSDDPFGSVEAGRVGTDRFADAAFYNSVGHLPWLDAPEACGGRRRTFLSDTP